MLKPAKMAKIDIEVPEEYITRLTLGIANLNIIHLMNIRKTPLGETDSESNQENFLISRYRELEHKLEYICKSIELELSKVPWYPVVEDVQPHEDIVKLEKEIKKIEDGISPILNQIASKTELKQKKQRLLAHMEIILSANIDIKQYQECKFLYISVGLIPIENLDRLELSMSNIYHIVLPSTKFGKRRLAFVMGSKKDQEKIEKALRSAYFEKLDLNLIKSDVNESSIKDIQGEVQDIDDNICESIAVLNKFRRGITKRLFKIDQKISLALNILETAKSFDKVGNCYHISGWVPQEIVSDLEREVKKASANQAKIKVITSETIRKSNKSYFKIPTCLKNPFFIKPFEKIIYGYGIPDYNEIEPTIFFAFSFILMFGVMFGDVGHGLTLFILGLLAYKRAKRDYLGQMGLVIMECGIMSTFFGFLYGSIFGFEDILPALWFHPMKNIYYFMKLALGFGIGIISLGLILNIINSFKNRDFMKGIFGELGVMGLIFYWGCVGLFLIYMIKGKFILNMGYFLLLLLMPLLFIFLKEPLFNLYNKLVLNKDVPIFPHNLGLYFLESLIEIGDAIIGFLSNTVSFIRVAAFALAHAGLFFAVFALAQTFQSVKGGFFWYWMVVIFGNVCIIGIEGLVVSIQTIRLEYYEFFSKFFMGGGELYKPLVNK